MVKRDLLSNEKVPPRGTLPVLIQFGHFPLVFGSSGNSLAQMHLCLQSPETAHSHLPPINIREVQKAHSSPPQTGLLCRYIVIEAPGVGSIPRVNQCRVHSNRCWEEHKKQLAVEELINE